MSAQPAQSARVVNGYTIAPWANLRGANLRGADLRGAELSRSDLSGSDLRDCNLSGSNLSRSDLSRSDLSRCNLSQSDLSGSDLSRSDLRGSNLSQSNLSGSELSRSDLSGSDLSGSDLRDCNLSGSNLSGSDLSGAVGLLSPIDWLAKHLERTDSGFVAYKQLGLHQTPPVSWEIEAGSVISEVVNPDRTTDCACGVNVAGREWFAANGNPSLDLWRVLVRWEWLPGVIVPYHTDGKIRCERVELVERVANWQEAEKQ